MLPDDDFLARHERQHPGMRSGVWTSRSGIVTIDERRLRSRLMRRTGSPSPYITLEKAQEIALAQANVPAADAVFDDKEFDHDDGDPGL